ncbi:MAG: sugar ABC transporter permease [Rhodospirillales bacterium]|nr:sugar ABC transporter permease [Rhodospirillales bacterium]MDE2199701.1 sugar ABC transporter permease [Rhodospirillales bacterium]
MAREPRALTGTLAERSTPRRAASPRVREVAARLALVPTVLVMAVCFYGSIVWTVYISMTRSSMLPEYGFAGLFQYNRLFNSLSWQTTFDNMFIFGFLDVVGTLGVGILLAVVVDRHVRFESLFRTILLYPLALSFIVTGLAWQWILSPTIGIEHFVRGLGFPHFVFDWITQPETSIYTLVFAGVWHQSGFIMVVILAGLRGIDPEIWRATRVDGIPVWRAYVSVILPMLRPLIVTCIVLIVIAVVKSYDLVVAMTGGGPGFSSDLPAKFVIDYVFQRANIGEASAAAVIMLGSVIAIMGPYLHFEMVRKR